MNAVDRSHLMNLPAEIRSLIWSYTLDYQCLHVTHSGYVWCDTESISEVHDVNDRCQKARHLGCPRYRLVCLAVACRQIFHEVAQIRPEKTSIVFSSSGLALSYLSAKLSTSSLTHFSVSQLRSVQLYLGPAKHDSSSNNAQNWSMLELLARDASQLTTLNLGFIFFYRATQDILPLGRKLLAHLLRFTGLTQFNMHMEEAPPGPVDLAEQDDEDLKHFWLRWRCTETALRLHMCRTDTVVPRDHISRLSSWVDGIIQASLFARRHSVDTLRDLLRRLEADRLNQTFVVRQSSLVCTNTINHDLSQHV